MLFSQPRLIKSAWSHFHLAYLQKHCQEILRACESLLRQHGQVHYSMCVSKKVILKCSHQGLQGQPPCECLFTCSLALTVKTDMTVDLLLQFVPTPFSYFFPLCNHCLPSCNTELNLISKGKVCHAQTLLGKNRTGKSSSTLIPSTPSPACGVRGSFPMMLVKVWDTFVPTVPSHCQ